MSWTLALNPATGTLELVQFGSGGGGGTPGGADTSVQFNDGGSFGGFGTWDGSTLSIPGLFDFNSGTLSLDITSVPFPLIKTDSTSGLGLAGTVSGGLFATGAINLASDADAGANFNATTVGDAATGSASFTANVHVGGSNAATAGMSVDGASGNNTPDTTFTFPGNALFNSGNGVDDVGVVFKQSFAGNAYTSYQNILDDVSAGSGFEVATNLDTQEGPAIFNLTVHNEGADFASFSARVRGDQGATPDTLLDFPGAALFTGASEYKFQGTGQSVITADANGTGVAILQAQSSDASSGAVGFTGRTALNSDTSSPFFSLTAHGDESDIAVYNTTLRGDQGAAADVLMQFPSGIATYTGASGYSFDNTVDATAYSVNGNAGASGTGTVITAITVENGIITAITVA